MLILSQLVFAQNVFLTVGLKFERYSEQDVINKKKTSFTNFVVDL